MFKVVGSICITMFSFSAFAYQTQYPTFGAFAEALLPAKVHDCVLEGWMAAGTSDDQTAQAQKVLNDARGVLGTQQAAIETGITNLNAAWAKYPVDATEVMTAEAALDKEIKPVKESFRGAAISVLNLMTADQRKLYDADFATCIVK